MPNFVEMQRRFILSEGHAPPDMNAYIQSVEEILNAFTPRTATDSRRLSIARENLRNLRRYGRRLQQENSEMRERLSVLEENSE